MSLSSDLQYAVELARGAARIVVDHYGRVERRTKQRGEAVTDADRASQRFIVAGLRTRYPGDGIVGEENDTGDSITFDCPDPNGRVWVIDPIDGTNNFVAGLGNFAVCIGLLEAGRPVLGVVLDVCRNEVYCAAAGEGVYLDDKKVRVADVPLSDASILMLTANLLDKTGRLPQYAAHWMSQTAWKIRILGSAALEAAHVASGVAHAALTVNGKLWDAAAPAALVLEAGGVITDLAGQPVFPFDLRGYTGAKVPFLAAAPAAHPVLLRQMLENP